MIYNASATPGLRKFASTNFCSRPRFVYAALDPFSAVIDEMTDYCLIKDAPVLADETGGQAVLWECCPGAFQKVYGGKSCFLYGLPEDKFLRGQTAWETVAVCTDWVPVISEEQIEDVYTYLLQGAKEGLCVLNTYSDSAEYRSKLSEARKRINARLEEPEFIIEDGILKQFSAEIHVDDFKIPDGVKIIGERAFAEASIGCVTIPDGVTLIGEEAFYGSCVRRVIIPASLRTIERWAFGYCEALKDITIPETVTEIQPYAIGYRRAWTYWDPEPTGVTVTINGKYGSEAERYARDNDMYHCEFITKFIGE